MKTSHLLLTSALTLVLSAAQAEPVVGRAFPSFTVSDLNGASRTHHDLTGRWRVVFAMSDKDTGPALTSWYRRVESAIPDAARVTLVAIDLFGLIPTSTVVSQARENTPRTRWGEVWLSRDGSLAHALGLPESETPWVFVIDPAGRVVEAVHATVDDAGVARVRAALGARTASAQ